MKIGMIGLGRMGGNMTLRLLEAGHQVVAFNRNREKLAPFVEHGAVGATSYEELVDQLDPPRVIWLMVPAAAVDDAIAQLRALLRPGHVIVDAGNSHYRDDLRRAQVLAP